MQLTEIRQRLTAAARKMGKSYGPEELDMAIQTALNEADLSAYHSLSITSNLTFTVNQPEISVATLTGFRPERVTRAMLAYNDRGTWATATAYTVNDLVQGDGSPDSYYYHCTEAHTSSASNEPGQGDNPYWERTLWKRGDVIEIIDTNTIAHMLGDRAILRNYLPDDFIFATVADANDAGKPRFGSFLTEDIFVVYPPPLYAYKLQFIMRAAVTDWTPGTEADIEIDIPDNVLLPMIVYGAAYFLDMTVKGASEKKVLFDQHIRRIDGNTAQQGAGVGYKDRAAYADHTDGLALRGRWPYGV